LKEKAGSSARLSAESGNHSAIIRREADAKLPQVHSRPSGTANLLMQETQDDTFSERKSAQQRGF
jgi:hypothetical protein